MKRFKPGKKKCEVCGNEFEKNPHTPFRTWCDDFECIKVIIKKRNEKKQKKDWQEHKKAIKEKLKTLTDYKNEARAAFQKFIRLRDKDLPCISCGRFANRYDGGHYFDANQYTGLIFNEDNCHKQCSANCNKHMHGNKVNYRIGLVKKIGEPRVKWLEENKDSLRMVNYTKEDYIRIRRHYELKCKELEAA